MGIDINAAFNNGLEEYARTIFKMNHLQKEAQYEIVKAVREEYASCHDETRATCKYNTKDHEFHT